MKKLINFTAWYADRKRIEEECKEQRACNRDFTQLVEARTEEDWVAIIQENFGWVCDKNIGGINKFVRFALDFKEGFAAVKCSSSGLYGFLRSNGTMLTGFEFVDVWGFTEGFTLVQDSSGLWGFMKTDGTMLTGFKFADAYDFQEGFARVQDSSGLWGFLKSDGTMLTGFKFADAFDFQEGFAAVEDSSSGLWGFMKTDGTMLTKFQFFYVQDFHEGFAHVQKDEGGEWEWINNRGEYTVIEED